MRRQDPRTGGFRRGPTSGGWTELGRVELPPDTPVPGLHDDVVAVATSEVRVAERIGTISATSVGAHSGSASRLTPDHPRGAPGSGRPHDRRRGARHPGPAWAA